MQVEVTRIDPCNQDVKLIIDAETASAAYRKQLLLAGKSAQIPGFRKGKAPLKMIERTYGEKVKDYFYEEIAEESFRKAIKEHDLRFLLYPELQEVTWNEGEDLHLVFKIETEPEIELKQTEGLSVPYKPTLLETEVESYIQELLKENSLLIEVEDEVRLDDIVDAEISYELASEKKSLTKEIPVVQDQEKELGFEEHLIGMKIGESKPIQIYGYDLASLHEVEPKLDDDLEYECIIMINAIRRKQIPALNDDFAKDMDFDSLEAMREKIADELRLKNDHKNLELKLNALFHALYETNKFPLPAKVVEHLLNEQVKHMKNGQYLSFLKQYYTMEITNSLVNTYLFNKLRAEYQLTPTKADKDSFIEHRAILEDRTVENWKETNAKRLEDEDFMDEVQKFLILKMLMDKSTFVVQEDEPEELQQPEDQLPEEAVSDQIQKEEE